MSVFSFLFVVFFNGDFHTILIKIKNLFLKITIVRTSTNAIPFSFFVIMTLKSSDEILFACFLIKLTSNGDGRLVAIEHKTFVGRMRPSSHLFPTITAISYIQFVFFAHFLQ